MYVKKSALATMMLCMLAFISYIIYSMMNSRNTQAILQRKISDKRNSLSPTKESFDLSNNFYAPLETSDNPCDQTSLDVTPKEVFKCVALLVTGAAIVGTFSSPMIEVITALTNKHNRSFIRVPTFYVSYVITSLCTNVSELCSSLIFASKKTKENITMTVSQLLGAATMNNTLCLSIFMALVYFKDLEWIYGAEVVCILLVQWVVGGLSWAKTYKLWMAIPVGLTYFICMLLVWTLEREVGWH